MRMYAIALLGLAAMLALVPAAGAKEKPALKTQKDKVSYIIGLDVGRKLKAQHIEVDAARLAEGIRDGQSGAEPRLTEDEIHKVMADFGQQRAKKEAARKTAEAAKNKKEGEAFLAANKKKPGVKTTASGLQYKVIKAGKGKSPTLTDSVVAHYRGTLIDGTEFDSSYARGKPATFPVSGVIPGWTEVLQLMKPGAKWMVYIPPQLAYGEHGAGRAIGPNATLIFEIELLGIEK